VVYLSCGGSWVPNLVRMADKQVSGECSPHISVKSKGNNDVTISKSAENAKSN